MFWLVSPQCWSKLLHSSLLSEANVAASGNTMQRRPASCQPPVSIIIMSWLICTKNHGMYIAPSSTSPLGNLYLAQLQCLVQLPPWKVGRWGVGGKKPCPHYQASGRRTLLLIGHFCSTGISALYHTISYYTIQCLSGSVCCKTSTTVHGWHHFKRKYFRLQARSSL